MGMRSANLLIFLSKNADMENREFITRLVDFQKGDAMWFDRKG